MTSQVQGTFNNSSANNNFSKLKDENMLNESVSLKKNPIANLNNIYKK